MKPASRSPEAMEAARHRPGTEPAVQGSILSLGVTSLWVLIGWLGWAVALAGLASLQKYVNDSGSSYAWAINANYPLLQSGRIFRLDWFILFFEFVVLVMVTIALLTAVLPQARIALCCFLTAAVLLTILATDRMYNVSHQYISDGHFQAARAAFTGFLLCATANLALVYMLGLTP